MIRAAVGLFENSYLVDEIVHDLEASGFPRDGIRVLSEPRDIAGSGMMSTPHTDFEVDLVQELRTMGATEAEADTYVQGVRRGGVIVFATGSSQKAEAAAKIMNHHHAVEIEELSASEPHLPGAHRDSITPGRNTSVQSGRVRTTGGGAHLFVW